MRFYIAERHLSEVDSFGFLERFGGKGRFGWHYECDWGCEVVIS
jgi:hypothetical protein